MTTTLDVLRLGPRARNALEFAGVKTLSDLTALRRNDLLRKKNIGRKTLREIVEALHQHGLYLRDQGPAAVQKEREQEMVESLILQKARVVGEAKQAVQVLKSSLPVARLIHDLNPLIEAVEALDRAEQALAAFRSKPSLTEIYAASPHFFKWVEECCTLLGKPREFGEHMMPEVDLSWWACFDDGMTPEEAVTEYRAKVPETERP